MMKKGMVKRLAVAAMAALMMATAVVPSVGVFANDGTGIYAEQNMSVKDLNKEVTITVSAANVREGAGTSYRVLNKLPEGTKVTLTGVACREGEETGWYRVWTKDATYGGQTAGYIYKSTFATDNGKVESKDVEGQRMTVTGTKNYLGLRTEASSNEDAEIARLYNGYTVTVLRTEGKYAYVYSNNLGLEGYVNAAYLK